MKLLHTADLHLGSPLRAATARDAAQGEVLRRAADGVLGRIVDVALAEGVDAVVMAGDVFDGDVPDTTLRGRLMAELRRLTRAGIAVVMIRGNHDSLMDLERFGPLGENIHLLDADAPSVRIGEATFHGLGFAQARAVGSMLPDYPAPEAGRLNIGLMHTSLDGAAGHDPYAPCRMADLLAHGYDYWALGHIHKRAETVRDGVALVMPGIPQGRHAGEPGRGTVTIATLGGIAGGAPELRQVPVGAVAFESVPVDLTGADQSEMIDALARAAPGAEDHHRLIRLVVSGSDLSEGDLLDLARAAIEGSGVEGGIGIEAVCRSAACPPEGGGDIARLMVEEAASESYRDEARAMLAEWRTALPREVADVLDDDALDTLIGEGLAAVGQALRSGP